MSSATFAPEKHARLEWRQNLVVMNRHLLKQQVIDLLAEGKRSFVIDFTHCGYIDCSGCGVLVSLSKKIRDAQGELALVGLNDDLLTLFDLTHLSPLFTIERP